MVDQAHEEQSGPSIEDADILVTGGRGLGDPEKFSLLEELAAALGAAVGSTRAVVDSGWYPYATQIGQTGKVVSPKLYIGAGVSGAIQHKVGMQTSQVIVAINKDANAPDLRVQRPGRGGGPPRDRSQTHRAGEGAQSLSLAAGQPALSSSYASAPLRAGSARAKGVAMKTDIHPEYVVAHVRCSCGNEFETRSTKPEIKVEICSNCHPFYTGRQKLVDTGGRVERFQRKLAKRTGA